MGVRRVLYFKSCILNLISLRNETNRFVCFEEFFVAFFCDIFYLFVCVDNAIFVVVYWGDGGQRFAN